MRAVVCGANGAMGKLICEILGDDVVLIDSGKETATGIKMTLENLDLLNEKTSGGNAEVFVTNNTSAFDDVARMQLINNADHLLSGCYAGTIDMKKINKSELNWMKEL